MEGFEGLKFEQPEGYLPNGKGNINRYWSIRLDTLSPEQLEFLSKHFKRDTRYVPESPCQDIIMGDSGRGSKDFEYLWSNDTLELKSYELSYSKLSFNDLFKEV